MSSTITLQGSLDVGGDQCSTGCGSGDRTTRGLAFQCSSAYFQGAFSTDIPVQIATLGQIGAAWLDLPSTRSLLSIELLSLKTNQPVRLRIGAAPAVVTGVGGTFPTLFGGGETLTFDVDGQAVSVAFLIGDQSAAQVAARINAACALLALPTPVATVNTSGQLALSGLLTGVQGDVNITGGSGRATLGLALGKVLGGGSDVDVFDIFLLRTPQPSAITRVQISGVATIEVLAAGRTTP